MQTTEGVACGLSKMYVLLWCERQIYSLTARSPQLMPSRNHTRRIITYIHINRIARMLRRKMFLVAQCPFRLCKNFSIKFIENNSLSNSASIGVSIIYGKSRLKAAKLNRLAGGCEAIWV